MAVPGVASYLEDVCPSCLLKRQAVVKAVTDTPLERLDFSGNEVANIEVSSVGAFCAGLHCRVQSMTAQIP